MLRAEKFSENIDDEQPDEVAGGTIIFAKMKNFGNPAKFADDLPKTRF